MDATNTKKYFVEQATKLLLNRNDQTSTLEVKTYLRELYPNISWEQLEISKLLDEIYNQRTIPDLEYIDNGQYRTYFIDDTNLKANFVKFVNDDFDLPDDDENDDFDSDENDDFILSKATVQTQDLLNKLKAAYPMTNSSPTKKTEYSFKVSSTATFTTSNLQEAKDMITNLKLPYYYSESKDRFLHVVDDMDPQHVYNAIMKKMKNVSSKEELITLLDSPLVTALINSNATK